MGALMGCGISGTVFANSNVYVSRFWHNHQPLYWPEWNTNGSQIHRAEYAWDSISLKFNRTYEGSTSNHPENNLENIFGLDDRRNAYQGGPRNSLTTFDSRGGFALSYSGSLIDNVRQLGGGSRLGYGPDWNAPNREARGWQTPAGNSRLDLVGFTYHHSLAPLLPKEVFRKEIQLFKQAWWKAWDGEMDLSDHSKGFFPTEMAYSRHMIDVLVDEGYEWVIVASHHISRTAPTYFDQFDLESGTYGIFSSPPNKADLLGPSPTDGWWYSEPNPGNAAWNVAPYAYQLHQVAYTDPETGDQKSMIAVPSDDVLSYRFGYANEGISKINDFISPYATDPDRPVMVMPATDGDNAWGGGSSSWFEATPQYFNGAASQGYIPSTPQDMVDAFGAHALPAHIEDGAWIFPESDYGSPYFLKWIEPPVAAPDSESVYPGTIVDMETPGFALKFWSWAPVITGANWVETAEQILKDEGGTVEAWKIQAPYDWDGGYTNPNEVELAWHIYLKGLDSGFNYYGGLGNDDEVKPAMAATRAIEKLQSWMTPERLQNDRTPPTVLKPQRFPYNPGGHTFGWFNSIPGGNTGYLKKMPSDFYIWTHAYDISGIESVVLNIRIDADGINPLDDNANELYAGGPGVGDWIEIPMEMRTLPNDQNSLNAAANNGEINYFITPPELADYYFAAITEGNVPGFRGKLLDYYIEATDTRNNVHKSEIQHVFVQDSIVVTPPAPQIPAIPTGFKGEALSDTRISLQWDAVDFATRYRMYRDGDFIDDTTGLAFLDTNLESSTTYQYELRAENESGVSSPSDTLSITTQATPPQFEVGDSEEPTGYLVSQPGMRLFAAVRGTLLFVGTWTPSGGVNDHMIFVTDSLESEALIPGPWDKAGATAHPEGKPFLAAESDNQYISWFNASGTVWRDPNPGGRMEGVLDLVEVFGYLPERIFLAAAAYQTDASGVLGAQAPAGNGDTNLDPAEFLEVPLDALRDSTATGVFDRLDPSREFRIRSLRVLGNGVEITLPVIPGKQYRLLKTDNLVSGPWTEVGTIEAQSGDDERVIEDSERPERGFYRLELMD